MNSFVKSNPAAYLRDLRLVLMTSPEGRTTVYETRRRLLISTDRSGIQKPFTFAVQRSLHTVVNLSTGDSPIVAPGLGSN